MSKILFLADLHGNWQATEAMAAEIRKLNPERIYFLGDAIGKGPDNDKTLEWVRSNCTHFVAGNWDQWISSSYDDHSVSIHSYYWNQLSPEQIGWIRTLPLELDIWLSGIHFRLIHGRPIDQLYQDCHDQTELDKGLTSKDGTIYTGLICADSHRPFVRSTHNGYIMNTGSIGNSLGQANAHALLVEGELDSKDRSAISFNIISVPYDNEGAAKRAAECPDLADWEAYKKEVLTGYYSRQ